MEKEFISKKGRKIIFRPLKITDLPQTLKYMNALSKEDAFICLSGEVLTEEEERKFLESTEKELVEKKVVRLGAFFEGQLVGTCDIKRDRQRAGHTGTLGLMTAKDFRGEGIGRGLMEYVLQLGKEYMGLKMVKLGVFAINEKALKLYQKLGFVEYGKLPKGLLYKGEYIDHIFMYKEI